MNIQNKNNDHTDAVRTKITALILTSEILRVSTGHTLKLWHTEYIKYVKNSNKYSACATRMLNPGRWNDVRHNYKR
jgi:hypothetical protein